MTPLAWVGLALMAPGAIYLAFRFVRGAIDTLLYDTELFVGSAVILAFLLGLVALVIALSQGR